MELIKQMSLWICAVTYSIVLDGDQPASLRHLFLINHLPCFVDFKRSCTSFEEQPFSENNANLNTMLGQYDTESKRHTILSN